MWPSYEYLFVRCYSYLHLSYLIANLITAWAKQSSCLRFSTRRRRDHQLYPGRRHKLPRTDRHHAFPHDVLYN